MSYLQQRTWADQFNGQLNVACEEFIYSQRLLDITTKLANPIQDQRQGIDAISTASDITWAFRVRNSKAANYFNNEFTLRYREFDKLLDGNYADYMIYGLEDKDNPLKLAKVKLIDMNLAASQIKEDENLKDKILATEISYSASQPSFLCMKYSFFHEPIEIAESIISPYSGLSLCDLGVNVCDYGKAPRMSLKPPSLAS